VINRFFPIFPDADASGKSWVAILDEIDELHPHTIVPGHGEVGDATLIGTERTYLRTLQSRVVELKGQGKSADESVKLLSVEFRAKYPDWDNPGWIGDAVKRFYAEAQ
jgi:hypothetical protein